MADLNIQLLDKGYGSYLYGIIPQDQAVSAGALSYSLRQIKNIQSAKIESFSQAVFSLENNSTLPLTNGTNKPVDDTLQTAGFNKIALGSGPNGNYTMSDFFGCMSGLPYPWKEFYEQVKKFAPINSDLYNIYKELYLAISWERAVATWDGTTFTFTTQGGGYGRGGAAAPTVTVGGNPATAIIGTDPTDLDTYGKVISISYSGASAAVVIAIPPDNSTGGWPGMNSVVQSYIDQANALIATYVSNATTLNEIYKIIGQQLKVEQRARYIGISPVAIPKDYRSNPIPSTFEAFVDSIPTYAKETLPHMSAQTLENISDLNTVGGQSIIALMRSARNQAVLAEAGVSIDNNISDALDPRIATQLLLNGTVDAAVPGTGITPIGSVGVEYTLPPNSINIIGDTEITPCNNMVYDSCNETPLVAQGEIKVGTIETILNSNTLNNCIVAVNSTVKTGPYINPYTDPDQSPQAGAIVATQPNTPGGLNITAPILTPNLDKAYFASQMLCSTLSVQEAIDQVILCNCDCWNI